MADHDEFDDTELASAYLDGEVSEVERARVEGDASLLAEVERLRTVRAALGDVPPASSATREAAIAAALSAFDAQHPTAADLAGADAGVVPLDRRRRTRWMEGIAAAAAVALIVVGGFVIANRDDDDESTTARELESGQTTRPAAAAADDTATSPAAAPAAAPTTAAVAALIAEDTSAEPEQADAPMVAVAPSTSVTANVTANVLSESTATRAVIADPAQLAEFVASLDRPPPALDAVLAACRAGDLDDNPDAAVMTDEGAADVVIATTADGPVAVELADCAIVMRSPTGPTDADR
jgi:hypothetical protein